MFYGTYIGYIFEFGVVSSRRPKFIDQCIEQVQRLRSCLLLFLVEYASCRENLKELLEYKQKQYEEGTYIIAYIHRLLMMFYCGL